MRVDPLLRRFLLPPVCLTGLNGCKIAGLFFVILAYGFILTLLIGSVNNSALRIISYYINGIILSAAVFVVINYNINRLNLLYNGILVVGIIAVILSIINYFLFSYL